MPAQPAEAPPSSLFGHRSHANVGPLFAGLVTNPTNPSVPKTLAGRRLKANGNTI
jgi:hypothetical protein